MRPIDAVFVKSALLPEDFPGDARPEIAFIGRSNVGKSSLLNRLLHQKQLAKTSATPGKTRTINFFLVNNRYYFVDLPGYGYARVAKAVKMEWDRHMRAYLCSRAPLRMAVMLLDARHAPSDQDLHMLEILEETERPTLIVATKIDKLARGQRRAHLERLRAALDIDDSALVIAFSSVTGEGAREVWEVIRGL